MVWGAEHLCDTFDINFNLRTYFKQVLYPWILIKFQ